MYAKFRALRDGVGRFALALLGAEILTLCHHYPIFGKKIVIFWLSNVKEAYQKLQYSAEKFKTQKNYM